MHAQAAAEALSMTGTSDVRAVQAGQLVSEATGGDLDAFEELVRRLQRRVYGFAYHHLRDLDEAHDLTQEIFVKLYRNLARYDSARPFEPWFWKMAANTSINYRRKRVPSPPTSRLTMASPPQRRRCHSMIQPSSMPLRSSTRHTGSRSFFTTTPISPWSRSDRA